MRFSVRLTKRSVYLCIAWSITLGLAAAAIYSYRHDGIVGVLLRPGASAAQRIERIQQAIQAWGAVAPLAYVVFVMVEVVVAPIPGLMLYAPGGMIFGGFWGGLLSLIGNVLGAGVACRLMRVLGRRRLAWMWQGERPKALDRRLAESGVWVILALRINPLTSSDLVSYAAGLTSISTWKVMLGTLLGMAPLCFLQAHLADEVLSAFPNLLWPLIGACAVYAVLATITLRNALAGREAGE